MQVNYSSETVIKKTEAIFLAGPTSRNAEITAWRLEALKILERLDYQGVIYIPEFNKMNNEEEYDKLREWEMSAMQNAKTIVFWIPRDNNLKGLTTNVEFGYWLKSGKVIYGRPNDATEIRYLDWLYEKELKQKPFADLEKLLTFVVNKKNIS